MTGNGTGLIQAVEIKKGKNALTTGVHELIRVIHCRADGDIIVHFPDGDETVSLTAGEDRTVDLLSVTISSGTFDLN